MASLINSVEAVNESTVVALARACEAGSVISHELYDSLGDDGAAELTERIGRRGLTLSETARGVHVGAEITDEQIEALPKPHASGRNQAPRRLLGAPPEAWELMDRAAEKQITSWSDWARGVLAIAVAQELGRDEAAMVELFDEVTRGE